METSKKETTRTGVVTEAVVKSANYIYFLQIQTNLHVERSTVTVCRFVAVGFAHR